VRRFVSDLLFELLMKKGAFWEELPAFQGKKRAKSAVFGYF
jgi:hypothetical protein